MQKIHRLVTTPRTGDRKVTVTNVKPKPDRILAALKYVFIDGFQVFDSPIQPKHRTEQQIRLAVDSLE